MISIASLSTLHKKIREFLSQGNILSLGYFTIICCIVFTPIMGSFVYYYCSNKQIALLESQLMKLRQRYKILKDYENRQQKYRNLYRGFDSAYLDRVTQIITPLKDEIQYLQMILPFYPLEENALLRERLHFLQYDNRFRFHEITRCKNPFFDEVTIEQLAPIEINMRDLQMLLFHLEGISDKNKQIMLVGRPQIFISHLDMYKEKNSLSDTFMIKLQLIQRELRE